MREHRDEEKCCSEGPLLRAANAAAGPEHNQGTPPPCMVVCVLGESSQLLSLVPIVCVQVVIVGATKEIGRTAVLAVTKARGMELAGAIDSQCIGEDAGQVLPLAVHSVQRSGSLLYFLSHTSCKCWHCASDKWHGRTAGNPCAERPHHGSGLHSAGTIQYSTNLPRGCAFPGCLCLLQDIFG